MLLLVIGLASAIYTAATVSSPQIADFQSLRELNHPQSIKIAVSTRLSRSMMTARIFDTQDAKLEISTIKARIARNHATAPDLLRLGLLTSIVDGDLSATGPYSAAVDLLQVRTARLPDVPVTASVLVQLGRAQLGANHADDAERTLRKAVSIAPGNSFAWSALGEACNAKAASRLMGESWYLSGNYKTAIRSLHEHQGDTAFFTSIRTSLNESDRCFDQAVKVEPSRAQPYIERAAHRGFEGFAVAVICEGMLHKKRPEDVYQTYLEQSALGASAVEMLPDLKQAMELNSDEPAFAGFCVDILIIGYYLSQIRSADEPQEFTVKKLNPESRSIYDRACVTLERLANSKSQGKAIRAMSALTFVRIMSNDLKAAEGAAKAVLDIAPDRETALTEMTWALVQLNDNQGVVELYTKRIKQHDSVTNRMVLAEAYYKLDRWRDVDIMVLAALRLEPSNLRALIAQAAVYLHKGDADSLNHAREIFETNATRITDESQSDEIVAFETNRALWYAITGDTRSAVDHLLRVQLLEPNNETAAKALRIIEATDKRS
jgi:tetratricopeptide (TPR) repeat protein